MSKWREIAALHEYALNERIARLTDDEIGSMDTHEMLCLLTAKARYDAQRTIDNWWKE